MSWATDNQALLVAEFARLRRCLAGEDGGPRADPLAGDPAAIDRVAALFGLTAFERDVLLLVAGLEFDAALAAACAARGEATRTGDPTFALALAALPDSHWSALSPGRPLRRWRLVELDETAALASARLRVDERILHHLVGVDHRDARLAGVVLSSPPDETQALSPSQEALAERLSLDRPLLLAGDDRTAMAAIAARVAAAAGRGLLTLDADAVPAAPTEIEALATLTDREAMLDGAALLLIAEDAIPAPALRLAERLSAPLVVASREPAPFRARAERAVVDKPDLAERAALWRAALGDDPRAESLAATYRMGAAAIRDAAMSRDPGEQTRLAGRGRLDALATRVTDGATLDRLVVPEAVRGVLDAIVAQMRRRATVHLDWGMGRNLGIAALFAGESGTGKTMAAEAIANALGLDLYRIDLSQTVSKYIGETEKNLRRIFDAAEDSGAVLLFDEADALFGKRSEVRDSHDRYANIEVSYLLQRIEAHSGLAILTSNMKSALDPAFTRRLRFIVTFPFPDQAQREAIWRGAFPAELPREGVDPARLAQVSAPGGLIRTIALNAAFAAAEEGTAMGMPHLLAAARVEAAKRDRPLSDGETKGWR